MFRAPRTAAVALLFALVAVAGACGGDDEGGAVDESATARPDDVTETTLDVDPAEDAGVDPDPDDPDPEVPVEPDGTPGSMPSVPADEGIDDPPVVLADLDAAQVAPASAGGDATGRFEAVIESPGELCAVLNTTAAEVTGVHIHIGATGEVGEPLLDLTAALSATTEDPATRSGCLPVDEATAAALENSTDALYVDVHTAAAPDGAIRGQLRAATLFDLELDR